MLNNYENDPKNHSQKDKTHVSLKIWEGLMIFWAYLGTQNRLLQCWSSLSGDILSHIKGLSWQSFEMDV